MVATLWPAPIRSKARPCSAERRKPGPPAECQGAACGRARSEVLTWRRAERGDGEAGRNRGDAPQQPLKPNGGCGPRASAEQSTRRAVPEGDVRDPRVTSDSCRVTSLDSRVTFRTDAGRPGISTRVTLGVTSVRIMDGDNGNSSSWRSDAQPTRRGVGASGEGDGERI